MHSLNILHFISADPTLGKIDKHSLPQQTIMELLIEKIENKYLIHGETEAPKDVSEWIGVAFEEGEIYNINWYHKQLSGSIPLEWLPSTVQGVYLQSNVLTGTVDLTCLPDTLRQLNLRNNKFYGEVDLTNLPKTIIVLILAMNSFGGKTDFSQLPRSLSILYLEETQLEGEVFDFGGALNTMKSKVKDMREMK